MGLTSTLPGFVEPTPEFFARMGRLVRDTEILLRESGAFDRVELSLDAVVREVADKIELRIREMPSGESGRAYDFFAVHPFEAILTTHHDMMPKQDEWENARAYAARVVPLLRQLALDHATGARPIDALLQRYMSYSEEPIERLWRRLSDLFKVFPNSNYHFDRIIRLVAPAVLRKPVESTAGATNPLRFGYRKAA